jgi:manganese-dependent ADP-ribose/CDP-alcohol diphosphatase
MHSIQRLTVIALAGAVLPVLAAGAQGETPAEAPLFSFGLIADCQYHHEPGEGVRKYDQSGKKLEACVEHLNTMDLAFVCHLGDFIDRDFESFDVVGPIYEGLTMPKYHVLGNHDYTVDDDKKAAVPEKLGMPAPYYDFTVEEFRFVVLDGNDISFHAHPKDSEGYQDAERYYAEHRIESPRWNGAIGPGQLAWLKGVLEDADTKGQRAVVFCHFPVYPDNAHNLWNANEVMPLLESFACVTAYINGHNHGGHYGEKNGIHYVTLKGMVDTEETAYAVVHVYANRLEIEGFGREEDRTLTLR